ncbi:hypothetical protein DICSQDRAFT_76410 [Dichomitus squalens LYAD-421 SS1]|uniref:Integral membrane protein n=1 Tax=Dichomitus squalens TaxID=114155 RepID=A0A4Q9N3M4_9APHY|nr:uncharacterized protein DICSQDRAFT_76410 [Dichomitus squalens LYAD-421 SS1]EJF67051.1 hypothetical protein DICSQDRAFT_76410 [Dichomitus squalens LYAD-421 SS1]TBU34508.1 hypothetical protein BD311DRAFT_710087 [Dichomitus squalens]
MSAVQAKQVNPLLAAYLRSLSANPLRTKAITTALLQFFQEILASHLAGAPPPRVAKDAPLLVHLLARAQVSGKAFKMAAYGALISAPLSHSLVNALQKFFAGKTGLQARLGMLLASQLIVAPIQIFSYLSCMAVINGAKSVDEVAKTLRAGFGRVLRITWMTSPVYTVFAQQFLPPEMWVPFFNFMQFLTGTYFNTKLKKLRLEADAKAKKEREDKKD